MKAINFTHSEHSIPEAQQPAALVSLDIYDRVELERVIQYERLRSDRLNQPLSLVVFRLEFDPSDSSSGDYSPDLKPVIQVLLRRARRTDAVGWFGPDRLAVLLTSTDANGSARFRDAVCRDFSRRGVSPVFVEISTYPDCAGAEGVHGGEGHTRSSREEPSRIEAIGNIAGAMVLQQSSMPENLEPVFCKPIPRWKRTIDIIGSLIGMVLLSPLFAVVAVYIKIVSPGPALFVQSRVGYGGRGFRFYKFRTMSVNNDEAVHSRHATDFIRSSGSMAKLDERDPRIFPGGRILRVSAIDELPQLYNVFRGDMSLVGPRPCIPYEAAEYQLWHRHRFSILPGLTGLWQVSGKNKLSFAEMIRLDIRYEKKMSIALDLIIILRTFPTVVGLVFEAVGRRLRGLKLPVFRKMISR